MLTKTVTKTNINNVVEDSGLLCNRIMQTRSTLNAHAH